MTTNPKITFYSAFAITSENMVNKKLMRQRWIAFGDPCVEPI